jgi:acyl carrier protein
MAYDEGAFRRIVIESLQIPEQRYQPDLRLGDIEEWDSIAHLDLVSAIEQGFDLRLTTDEIVALTGLEDLRVRIKQVP